MVIRVLLGIHYYSNAEVFRGSILWILGSTSSILDACTAGTACTRGYVLLILPVLEVFQPSVLLILQVLRVFRHSILLILPRTRSIWAVSLAHTPSTRSIFAVGTAHTPSTGRIGAVNSADTPKYSQYLGCQYGAYSQ